MADAKDCDPDGAYPYATDCYACDNIDSEDSRHGFSLGKSGNIASMDMGGVDETFAALCQSASVCPC